MDRDMAMHWIDRYAAGIDGECQLDRIIEALNPAESSGGDAVAEITGIDEYGPMLAWNKHWTDVGIGTKLYAKGKP